LRCRYGNFDGNSHGDFHGDFYGDFYGDFALTQTQQHRQYNLATTTLPIQPRNDNLATPLALRTPLQEQPKATERHCKSNRKQPNATARATESSTAN
jgi:hypothetical protein